jgi:hypothetical protein
MNSLDKRPKRVRINVAVKIDVIHTEPFQTFHSDKLKVSPH